MKTEYQFPGGGPAVQADVTKKGELAVHKSLGSAKGYCVTVTLTGALAGWARTVAEAKALRKELEGLDWSDLGPVESVIYRHRRSQGESQDA